MLEVGEGREASMYIGDEKNKGRSVLVCVGREGGKVKRLCGLGRGERNEERGMRGLLYGVKREGFFHRGMSSSRLWEGR